MQLYLTPEEVHWMRYALIRVAGEEESNSPQRAIFFQIISKLSEDSGIDYLGKPGR